MRQFETKTLKFIKKHQLLDKGDYLLAAVSGGPDSLAMLDFFANRLEEFAIQLAVAHVDHKFRGEESHQDLLFVQKYCSGRNIPFYSTAIDIYEKMASDKTGSQETARIYRYRYLEKVMKEIGANKLMVAHHGDDQIETILMRLVRGASGKARAGMSIRRTFGDGELIRPLLAVSKREIEEYCQYYKLKPRIDPSNQKRSYTRNRFRLDILPIIKEENNQALEHFGRFHQDVMEDELFLQHEAEGLFKKICQVNENGEIYLKIPPFLAGPLSLQRRVIHLILNYLYQFDSSDFSAVHTDMIQNLVKSDNPSGRLDFPKGVKVIRSYSTCHFTFSDQYEQESSYCYKLDREEKVELPNGRSLELRKLDGASIAEGEISFVIDIEETQLPLIIRTRKQGDRISLKGMKGSKKIKDIFIDEKVPKQDRASWPIVLDPNGRVLWIPGLKKSSYEGKAELSQTYVLLYK